MFRFTLYISLLSAFCLSLSPSAYAKTKANKALDGIESPLSVLYICADIVEPMTRLACYDKQVASLHIAEEKKEIVAIDASVARKIKKEAFGFNLPSLPKIGLPILGGDDKIEALTVAVKSIRKSARKYVITLENGQIWEQTSGNLSYIPKGDLTAIIKPKSMGSFMITIKSKNETLRGMRVRRVQ